MYYPTQTQATPLTTIRRERLLPVPGRVLVRVGERVDPQQVVAEAMLPSEFRIVPVARALGLSLKKAAGLIRVKTGDHVEAGQVIAARRGLSGRTVKSPIAGRVTASGAGRVLIEAEAIPLQLPANLYGEVTAVRESFGVVIEAKGALVQGVWGSGGEGFGVLKCMVRRPDEPLLAKAVDPSCHGAILVGGSRLEEGVLRQATEMHVRGIVLGGLPAELLPQVADLPFPVVVTEGIGAVPMSMPLFRILATNDGREAAINGAMRTRGGVIRPDVVIPLPAETIAAQSTEVGLPFRVGMRVRVVRAPHMGATGTITALPTHARAIETSARVRGAEMDLGQSVSVFVPLANLEALY